MSSLATPERWRNSTHGACPVYDTCLSCLCLEVYYRFLPTFVKIEEVGEKKAEAKEDDDIKVNVGKAL